MRSGIIFQLLQIWGLESKVLPYLIFSRPVLWRPITLFIQQHTAE